MIHPVLSIVALIRKVIILLLNQFLFARRTLAQRIVIPLVVVAVAFVLRMLIGTDEMGLPYLTFFPAAAISAFLGGFWSGMLAAVIGSILASYYYIPPYSAFVFEFHSSVVFGNVVYLLDELIVCSAMAALRRYHLQSKEQIAEMQTLIQTIPEMIWLKSPNGIYLKCNIAFERLVGKPRAEIIGQTDRDLFGEDLAQLLRTRDLACITSGEPRFHEAWIFSAEHQKPILRETIKVAMRTQEGKLLGVLGIGRDITERREMEATIAHHQRELENLVEQRTRQVLELNSGLEEMASKAIAASQAKTAFLANMSHEIRTPMNAIMGLSHLLGTTRLDDEQQDFVRKIHGAGQALLSIINDVLDFSKIEAGRMELHHEEFDLDGLLDEVALLMAGYAGQKELELIVIQDPNLPGVLKGDGLRLSQILINLVGNAIKFTPSGHVCLQATLLERRQEQVVLRFVVRDTGIGIRPEVLEQLFQPFTQGDPSTTRTHGGTGLGLAISKRLVELMAGQLGASSLPDQGSEFWAEVPLEVVMERNTAHAAHPATHPDAHPDAHPPDVLSMLIVVDHALQQEALQNQAQTLGWSIADSASANALARQPHLWQERSLWILDRKLPNLDALLTQVALWRQQPDTPAPLLLLTLNAADQDAWSQSAQAGLVDALLTKPVTATSLFRGVTMAKARRLRASETAPLPPDATQRTGPRLAGVRTLLVDDCPINLEIAQRILELEGATVTTASQGLECLELLRAAPHGFDVILMDVQMPLMDGNEAVRIIRQEPLLAHLPVVALTAGAMESDRHRSLQAGMTDVIAKPFDVNRMIHTVQRLARGEKSPALPFIHAPPPRPLPEWPPVAGIDMSGVFQRLGGDWTLFVSLLRSLRQHFRLVTQEVSEMLAAGQTRQAAMRMHTLRGSAGNVGAVALQQMAGELETAILDGSPPEALRPRFNTLDQALETLFQGISPLLSSGVDDASTCSETPPGVDPVALQTLITALEAKNFQVLSLFTALSPALAAHLPATEHSQLARAIERLDCVTALEILRRS
ncbi:MAG: response regulator [Magnetococcales bacterium]|nr:response regulator [Magnetococcales bacterium]